MVALHSLFGRLGGGGAASDTGRGRVGAPQSRVLVNGDARLPTPSQLMIRMPLKITHMGWVALTAYPAATKLLVMFINPTPNGSAQ
ncbi:MAG: hypothetical protein AAF499_10045 [Pseudomonadota bacterium]